MPMGRLANELASRLQLCRAASAPDNLGPATTSIAQDHLREDAILDQVLAVGERHLPSEAGLEVPAQDGFQADGTGHEIVAGHAAGAEIEQTVALAQRGGQAVVAAAGVVEPVQLHERIDPAGD